MFSKLLGIFSYNKIYRFHIGVNLDNVECRTRGEIVVDWLNDNVGDTTLDLRFSRVNETFDNDYDFGYLAKGNGWKFYVYPYSPEHLNARLIIRNKKLLPLVMLRWNNYWK